MRSTVSEAVDAIRAGGFALVLDDHDRENEGDLIIAAEKVTPEKVAFMVRFTSGLICVPTAGERLDELEIPMMVAKPADTHDTAFTVSVDYIHGTTTGISAADRAATIRALADSATRASDLARPGHVFPLRYCEGGVLARPGHTEAAVDLAQLAGLAPVGVVCEVVADDGSMARAVELERFAKEFELPMISISDLVDYLHLNGDDATTGAVASGSLVSRVTDARLPTALGEFQVFGYRAGSDEIVALVKGDVTNHDDVLVRVHSECLTGDSLGSLRCDCRNQLAEAMARVQEDGHGVVLYVRGHEGRGMGLMPKLEAYALQDRGLDTVEANELLGFAADSRDFGVAAAVLRDLGVRSVRLLTNNPAKTEGLEAGGVRVSERVPMRVTPTPENEAYLATKLDKLGHTFDLEADGRT